MRLQRVEGKKRMRRWVAMGAVLTAAAALASTAGAVGNQGGPHQVWQIGYTQSCNNPDVCLLFGGLLGGQHGRYELDRAPDGTTWGSAEVTFAGHTVENSGDSVVFHVSFEITQWNIFPGPAGAQTFYLTGVEHVTCATPAARQSECLGADTIDLPKTNVATSFSAVPGHYTWSDIFHKDPEPGQNLEIEITTRDFAPASG